MTTQAPTIITAELDALDEHWETNPNHMEDSQYRALVESIRVDGFLQPILVRPVDGGRYDLCDGHHRVRAAKELGLVAVSAVVKHDVDELRGAALGIGMNRRRGELDLAEVAREARKFVDAGWSMAEMVLTTGFDQEEIEALLSTAQPDQDDVLGGGITGPTGGGSDDGADEMPGVFVLELTFTTKRDMMTARKALKKAAGGAGLGDGLLALLGE